MTERPVHMMSNPRADRVKKVAQLTGRSAVRRRRGQFLVEGPQSVREALKAHLGQLPAISEATKNFWVAGQVIEEIYFSDGLSDRDPQLFALIQEAHRDFRIFVSEASDEVLEAMSDAVTHQDIIAVASLPVTSAVPDQPQLVAGLIRVQDPGNVGTIIRTADAAGADYVELTEGTADPFSPKVVRSTAGSLFHLPIITSGLSAEPIVEGWRRKNLCVFAADGYGTLQLDTMSEEDLSRPTAWMFGNESQGLDRTERELADDTVAVPLYGSAESLNVSTAATVCLYASAMAHNR